MKFLALHGMGTNADILRGQLGAIVAELEDQGHEFVFVDGEIECETSDEIAQCYPGPFMCYYVSLRIIVNPQRAEKRLTDI
jgi:hypothetical protein